MEQSEFKQLEKEKRVQTPKEQPLTMEDIVAHLSSLGFGKKNKNVEEYDSIFQMLRTVRRTIDSAPTFTPKTFLEMFQMYENAGTFRLYVYLGGTWRYVALT